MNHDLPAAVATRVAHVLANVEIASVSSFRVGTGPMNDSAGLMSIGMPGRAPETTPEGKLRDALSSMLYFVAYARHYRGGVADASIMARRVVADPVFIAGLAAANPTQDRWEAGWRIFQADANGAVHVQKGDTAAVAQPGRYAFLTGAGRPAGVGDLVDIPVSRQSMLHQAGTYYAFGETIASDYDTARLSRLYFSTPAEHAAWLLYTLGRTLNRYYVPYRMKCCVDPAHFERCDGVVLYVARRFVPAVLRVLQRMESELSLRLREDTPLFAKPIVHGVGAADEPGGGPSFGQSRSRLLADAIVDAWRSGTNDPASRHAAMIARFREATLDASRPHLASGLAEIYSQPRNEIEA